MNLPILEIEKIKKHHPFQGKTREVLKGVSFNLYSSEIISLLGVNGAGKTTLSSILVTLIPPSSGQIRWRNTTVYKNLYAYRKIIGYCPQKPNLDPTLSLDQNLSFAGRYYGLEQKMIQQRKEKLIELFHLKEMLFSPLATLSGGYRQRFLLARTLMHDPQIVILDEPTVGLDPPVRRMFHAIIRSLKAEGKTVILTTHHLEEAEMLSDRVIVLNEGKILATDSPESLKEILRMENLEDVFLKLLEGATTK
jgi:ABC-2 type transport system ATP-binding protein